MANRCMLFAVTEVPNATKRPGKILALSEFGYDIPAIYKLLVSANSQICASVVWEEDNVAICGETKNGLVRLQQIRSMFQDSDPGSRELDEAITYLVRPHMEGFPYLLLEPFEVMHLNSAPFSRQIESLMHEVESSVETNFVDLAKLNPSSNFFASKCWSDILYYHPEGSVKPPLDPSLSFVYCTAEYVIENASVWPTCNDIQTLSIEGFDRNPTLLEEVLEILRTIHEPAFELTLRGEIDFLPEIICQLTHLKTLVIGQMGLKELPRDFDNLKNLDFLAVQSNAFVEFPSVLKRLTNLKSLSIWGNRFRALPDWIGELGKLETILIGGCGLSNLPEGFCLLKSLKELDISETLELSTFPIEILQLRSLQEIKIYGCNLSSLPDTLADLPNLRRLYAGDNMISALSENLWRKPLEVLSIANNGLENPPYEVNAKNLWI